MPRTPPVVLCISGHDPSGGAGIHADITTLNSFGCHACSVITSLTVQDTRNVIKVFPQQPKQIVEQIRTLFDDIEIHAVKVGLIGSVENAEALAAVLRNHMDLPIVIDPIVTAGGGANLIPSPVIDCIRSLLVPLTTLLTPNSEEARQLAPGNGNLNTCGFELLRLGCKNVLITGTHEDSPDVVNTLFSNSSVTRSFSWKRLPYTYHGSGCTLASAAAAMLAHGFNLMDAVSKAQRYTWNSLESAFKPGKGQYIPNRFRGHRQS